MLHSPAGVRRQLRGDQLKGSKQCNQCRYSVKQGRTTSKFSLNPSECESCEPLLFGESVVLALVRAGFCVLQSLISLFPELSRAEIERKPAETNLPLVYLISLQRGCSNSQIQTVVVETLFTFRNVQSGVHVTQRSVAKQWYNCQIYCHSSSLFCVVRQ